MTSVILCCNDYVIFIMAIALMILWAREVKGGRFRAMKWY